MAAKVMTAAADVAHASISSLIGSSPIAVGAKLPDIEVKEDSPDAKIKINDHPGKVLFLGAPGAFSGTCTGQIQGFIDNYEKFQGKGVSAIFVITVNDAFVTNAWKKHLAPGGSPVRFIADDKGAFTAGLGMLFDASANFGGPRSKRYALVVDSGKVVNVVVEESAGNTALTKWNDILPLV